MLNDKKSQAIKAQLFINYKAKYALIYIPKVSHADSESTIKVIAIVSLYIVIPPVFFQLEEELLY